MLHKKTFWFTVLFLAVLFTLGSLPGPNTLKMEHGIVKQGDRGCTRPGGCPYTVIWDVRHPSWIAAHAQVQNARGQAATLAYETQRFGATTATAASQGAVATTTFTWAVPFPDTNYTALCESAGTITSAPVASGTNQTANTAAAVKFTIATATASASSSTETDCIGIHD